VKRNLIISLILGLLLTALPADGLAQKKRVKKRRAPAKKVKVVEAIDSAPVVEAPPVNDEPPPAMIKIAPLAPEAAASRASLLAALPASDAVAFVDVRRILTEALPFVMAGDPKRLAGVNAQLDKFKAQTGLDPRSFENAALSLRVRPNAGGFDVNPLALVRGSFKAGALIAAGRFAAEGKYKQEEYKGKQIYLFDIGQTLKGLPLLDKLGKNLAVTELNDQTLMLGDMATLKQALDSNDDAPRAGNELIALATRNPNAMIGLAGNVPAGALAQTFDLDTQNDEIGKTVNAIRQIAANVSLQESGAELALAARTEKEGDAKNLSDTINALKQFAGFALGNLKPDQQKLAANALETLNVASSGNEAQISLKVKREDFPALLGLIK
jgi:hypothetical protein